MIATIGFMTLTTSLMSHQESDTDKSFFSAYSLGRSSQKIIARTPDYDNTNACVLGCFPSKEKKGEGKLCLHKNVRNARLMRNVTDRPAMLQSFFPDCYDYSLSAARRSRQKQMF